MTLATNASEGETEGEQERQRETEWEAAVNKLTDMERKRERKR
jgi:hypothetical protein